jgi:hypothetical protein
MIGGMHQRTMATMTPEQFEKFRAHLAKWAGGGLPACPICKRFNWGLAGPNGLFEIQEDLGEGGSIPTIEKFPVVWAICKNCFHILMFAWHHIEKGGP